MIYLYDNTLDGFFSLLYHLYKNELTFDKIISKKRYSPELFDENKFIETNVDNSEIIAKRLEKVSPYTLKTVIESFFSEIENIETNLYYYIKDTLISKKNIDGNLSENYIRVCNEASKSIKNEVQKYLGLIRFSKLKDDTFYAPIEPVHNVVPLVISHFKRRLADQKFVIHDVNRKIAAIYDLKTANIVQLEPEKDLIEDRNQNKYLHSEELIYQNLWVTFYRSVNIEERKNPRCQMSFMPKRYWKYLPEKK